jgi:hypothetical protein
MRVIEPGPGSKDPLARVGGVLLAAVLAFVLSVPTAALLASQVSGTYTSRAFTYLGMVVWVLVGAVLLVRATFRSDGGSFSLGRVLKWMISIWLWPLLLTGRRSSERPDR